MRVNSIRFKHGTIIHFTHEVTEDKALQSLDLPDSSEGCGFCGGAIFADTEDWGTPMCHPCYVELSEETQRSEHLVQD